MTANYRLRPTLQLGVEFNPVVGEVGPLATLFVLTETESRPAVFLGTSSDRIGSPEGTQAYYATVAKYLPALHLSPYASLNYSEWDAGWNFPFGANVEVVPRVTVQPMYDGHRTHLLATYAGDHYSVTAIYAWLESAGVAVSMGF